MDFKRYFGKIKNKKNKYESEIVNGAEENIVKEIKPKMENLDMADLSYWKNEIDSARKLLE